MPKQNSDFDPATLTQQTDEHTRNIAEIRDLVKKLDNRVGDNDKLAATFVETFESSKKLDKMLAKMVVAMIASNPDVKGAIGKRVREVDRDWQKAAIKRVGLSVWTILISLFSGGIVWLLTRK